MSKLNIEILAYEDTELGPLCLRRRELLSDPGTVVTEVTLNHEFLMSSLYTDSEQVLASAAIALHGGSNLEVLVAGLGLGYTAREALRSEHVAHVEVIELLPQVIDWLRQGLVPLSIELNDDPRLEIRQGDAYGKLAETPDKRYDVIAIDVDHSPDDRLGEKDNWFYSAPGLRAARRHLKPGGVMGIWSYAENSPFVDALGEVFDDVQVERVSHENHLIDKRLTDWLFFVRG